MEASQRRKEIFGLMRERIQKATYVRLDDRQVVQMAVACALRDSEELIGFIFSKNVAKLAFQKRSDLAISDQEWAALFGKDVSPLRDAKVAQVVSCKEFDAERISMSNALKCTMAEGEQASQYARPWTQALCLVGMHVEKSDVVLQASLGSIVRADARRLEELRERIDDTGVDAMLMARVVIALSEGIA